MACTFWGFSRWRHVQQQDQNIYANTAAVLCGTTNTRYILHLQVKHYRTLKRLNRASFGKPPLQCCFWPRDTPYSQPFNIFTDTLASTARFGESRKNRALIMIHRHTTRTYIYTLIHRLADTKLSAKLGKYTTRGLRNAVKTSSDHHPLLGA